MKKQGDGWKGRDGERERAAQSISPSIDQLMCCREDVILPEIKEGNGGKTERKKKLKRQRDKEGR